MATEDQPASVGAEQTAHADAEQRAPDAAATAPPDPTLPEWRRAAATGLSAASLRGMAAVPSGLALVTDDAIFAVRPAGTERLAALPQPRNGFAVCAVGPLVLLIGGAPGGERPDGRVLAYDTETSTWLPGRAPMPHPLDQSAVAVAAGLVHVLGGAPNRPSSVHQVYDPSANTWTTLPSMPVALAEHADRAGEQSVLHYQPETARWESLPELPDRGRPLAIVKGPAGFVAAAPDSDGQLLLYELTPAV